jgi:lipopolysaccharide transport system permease protein
MANPMASVIELFRYSFFGEGMHESFYIAVSWAVTIAVLFLGILFFSKIEKSFMDTV